MLFLNTSDELMYNKKKERRIAYDIPPQITPQPNGAASSRNHRGDITHTTCQEFQPGCDLERPEL